MAETAAVRSSGAAARTRPLAPTRFERLLAYGSTLLLAAVLMAVARGYPDWSSVPALVWLHLGTIAFCLALTPVLLLGRRGVRRHRQVGYAWVTALTATAVLTFGIRGNNHGGLSPIHALSAVTLTQAPMLAWHARRHRITAHRYTALSLVGGALLIAGLFTFPFGRLLGRWLLG